MSDPASRTPSDAAPDPASADALEPAEGAALAAGAAAAAAMFRALWAHSALPDADRDAAAAGVAPLFALADAPLRAGMRVDFRDAAAGRPAVAYLALAPCGPAHDLGAQLAPLRARVAPSRWPDVLLHLSRLVAMGRDAYAWLAHNHRAAVERLMGDAGRRYGYLRVDPENTTLFLEPDWPERVGIFVQLDAQNA